MRQLYEEYQAERAVYNSRVTDEAARMEAAVHLFNYAVDLLEKNGWHHAPFGTEASWEKEEHPWYWWRNDALPDGDRGTFTIEAALRTEHDRQFAKKVKDHISGK